MITSKTEPDIHTSVFSLFQMQIPKVAQYKNTFIYTLKYKFSKIAHNAMPISYLLPSSGFSYSTMHASPFAVKKQNKGPSQTYIKG